MKNITYMYMKKNGVEERRLTELLNAEDCLLNQESVASTGCLIGLCAQSQPHVYNV